MVPILQEGLSRSGIDRSFPRAVLFGPTILQGMGVMHPWHHQEITHLVTCLQQTVIGGITGSLISASLEQLRLEVGLPGFLTDHNFEAYEGLITLSWVARVWKFAHQYRIGIRDSEAKLHGRRSDDQFLMVSFVRAGFHGNDLTRHNICRMLLHAITLADICTIDGTSITHDAWLETRDPCSNSELVWPRVQQRLPPSSWAIWQRALRACFTNRSLRVLHTALGRWLRFPDRWVWHYSPAEDRLYKQEFLFALRLHVARFSYLPR